MLLEPKLRKVLFNFLFISKLHGRIFAWKHSIINVIRVVSVIRVIDGCTMLRQLLEMDAEVSIRTMY